MQFENKNMEIKIPNYTMEEEYQYYPDSCNGFPRVKIKFSDGTTFDMGGKIKEIPHEYVCREYVKFLVRKFFKENQHEIQKEVAEIIMEGKTEYTLKIKL
jgi:hypothetical protein